MKVFKRKILSFEQSDFNEFNKELIKIIDNIFLQKKKLHHFYFFLVQKVWLSSKPDEIKIKLAKYILYRLNRESINIINKSQEKANKICPHCQKTKKSNYYSYLKNSRIH